MTDVTVRTALAEAVGGLYRNSWRLVVANAAVAAAVLVPLGLAIRTASLVPMVLAVLAGPALAGLAYCVVTLQQSDTGEIRVADFGIGVRRLWRRGLALGGVAALVLIAGVVAVLDYLARGGVFLVPAFLCAYLLVVVVLFQLVLWPLAAHQADRPLATTVAAAFAVLLHRWRAVLALGLVLLPVTLLGAAAVLPLLTLTVAFSLLAAAHVVLPRPDPIPEV